MSKVTGFVLFLQKEDKLSDIEQRRMHIKQYTASIEGGGGAIKQTGTSLNLDKI